MSFPKEAAFTGSKSSSVQWLKKCGFDKQREYFDGSYFRYW